eukprot:57187-Prymnesium_polylepis.1
MARLPWPSLLEPRVGVEGWALDPIEPSRTRLASVRYSSNLLGGELEAENGLVLLQPLGSRRRRDRNLACLQAPPQQDLRCGLTMRGGGCSYRRVDWPTGHLGQRGQGGVRSHDDVPFGAICGEAGLLEVRMRFNLVAARLDPCALIDGLQVDYAPIADANGLGEALVDEALHLSPDLGQRGGEGRAVALKWGVHEVQVKVFATKRMQAAAAHSLDATLRIDT